MRISDWSSDVCSSDLLWLAPNVRHRVRMLGKVQLRSVFVNPEYSHGLPSRSCLLPATPLFREVLAAVAGSAGPQTVSRRNRIFMDLLPEALNEYFANSLHLPTPRDHRLASNCNQYHDNRKRHG